MRAWYTDVSGLHADLCQYPHQETTRLILKRSDLVLSVVEYSTWSDAIATVLAAGSGWTSDLTGEPLT